MAERPRAKTPEATAEAVEELIDDAYEALGGGGLTPKHEAAKLYLLGAIAGSLLGLLRIHIEQNERAKGLVGMVETAEKIQKAALAEMERGT